MRKAFLVIAGALAVLVGVGIVRTARYGGHPRSPG
jgi:hypothetical protein